VKSIVEIGFLEFNVFPVVFNTPFFTSHMDTDNSYRWKCLDDDVVASDVRLVLCSGPSRAIPAPHRCVVGVAVHSCLVACLLVSCLFPIASALFIAPFVVYL